ncbi:MAG: endonuclease domain-containing protein [Bacteroidales bacterium]|nr:endonuclease domain-containing protein [Bacteroidales bacterium]
MKRSQLPEMFYGAKRETFRNALMLRENMTEAEKILWSRLNKNQLGVRFRAQHPIDIFVVDFYCHTYKLIIEIDGEIHRYRKEYDQGRVAELQRLGLTVIRFTNKEIFSNIEKVMEEIMKYIHF